MLSCACRDTTPVDSDDHQPLDTSRDTPPPPSALQSHGFKASCDSLDGNVTPPAADVSYHDAGVVRSDQTNDIDSGVASGSPQQQPPLLKQVHAGKTRSKAHAPSAARSSAPVVHDSLAHNASSSFSPATTAPPAAAPELSEVQVPADGGDDSSDANSYYEDIDNIDDHGGVGGVPLLEPSERTSVSYLDPKTYFKAIEKMAQQGWHKDGAALSRVAIVEEWEASGRALLCRDDLVVTETLEAYTAAVVVPSNN